MSQQRPVVLITGVSGDAGQGILKGLRQSILNPMIIGLDYQKDNVGFQLCDIPIHGPSIYSKSYLETLLYIRDKYQVSVIMSGIDSEQVILASMRHKLENSSCKIVISAENLVASFSDKLLTTQWLLKNNLNAPYTISAAQNNNELSFPLIYKPRSGHGSIGVKMINTFDELDVCERTDDYVLQEYIDGDEYTIALLFNHEELCDSLILKRELIGGRTLRAEVVENQEIQQFVKKFADVANGQAFGPINLQLRLNSNNEVMVFEVNPRFSGSTSMRISLGYNEPARLLEYLISSQPISRQSIQVGAKVYRLWTELVVQPKEVYYEI